jgi:hypothetical protein
MLGLPITFTAPLVLIALAALPAIWLLLRVTPPQPRRIPFPPLRILLDLLPKRETPARTPWWLLLLRLLIAALIIVATAGPVWNPLASEPTDTRGPIVLIIDNGFVAAQDCRERQALAAERISAAGRDNRRVAILTTAERAPEPLFLNALAATERLAAIQPAPHLAERGIVLEPLEKLLAGQPEAEIQWIMDGVAGTDGTAFIDALGRLTKGRSVSVYKAPRAAALALAGADNAAGALDVNVVRAEPNGRDGGTLRALDLKGLPLGESQFRFGLNGTRTVAKFELPIEVRNNVARIDIADEASAGAVTLLDESSKRRRVGLVTGATADVAQPLLSPTYYAARALSPYADIREPRSGTSEAIDTLLNERVSVLVLADVGALDRPTAARLTTYVQDGGVLVRFAGPRLAAGNDELSPVKLRRGGRNLGGSLSWDTPKTLAEFPRESPFFGLPARTEITVRRQILAEPDSDLPGKTWAMLADGTPIVTAERRGGGLIVLFHVTADPAWSNLPLSGIFVDMLRRIVALAGKAPEGADEKQTQGVETVAPQRTLDGFGAFRAPPATAKPIARNHAARANEEHPPGFYGPVEAAVAVNALSSADTLAALDVSPLNARIESLARASIIDLRAPTLAGALVLLFLDTLAGLMLGGYLGGLTRRLGGATAAALIGIALVGAASIFGARDAGAQEAPRKDANEAALVTRLAYVVTGDSEVDSTSRAGLVGLSQALASRTALEPGDPAGVDPGRDELAFYPLLYWPVVAGKPLPSDVALRRIDAFMKGGGTVIFDTRDAIASRPGATTPEGQQLRRMLATLDIPELEPVPRDHVLTKAFFLVETFPGRYATGQTWVEVLPSDEQGERRPARGGDGVSPIIITSNDLAAAWAVGRRGEHLYPVVGADPRQREMSIRGGINIVMHTLTGNYKADQVHVPALLERLGQ